jgi:hypothetical protein
MLTTILVKNLVVAVGFFPHHQPKVSLSHYFQDQRICFSRQIFILDQPWSISCSFWLGHLVAPWEETQGYILAPESSLLIVVRISSGERRSMLYLLTSECSSSSLCHIFGCHHGRGSLSNTLRNHDLVWFLEWLPA